MGDPGGCFLCCRAIFCPCTVLGEIHSQAQGTGGFVGGCLCCLCMPCLMALDAPRIANKAGFQEGGIIAFAYSCSPCGICYMIQVRKEGLKLIQEEIREASFQHKPK